MLPNYATMLLFKEKIMLPIRYERHLLTKSHLPFIFHTDIALLSESTYSNWHDNTEFLFCIGGEGVVHSAGDDIIMRPGDSVIINPRCLHYITSEKSVSYRCLIIDNSFFEENGFDISKTRFISHFTDTEAGVLMDGVLNAFTQSEGKVRVAEIRLAVLNYILHICKNYITEQTGEGGKISKSHEAILKAVEFIDNNYEKHLTIDEIASVAGFSKFHFSRLFKNYTGFTVIEHINGRRCENAKLMLENNSLSISQIAAECGFDSCSYFAKSFEKSFGMLPSQYRKKISK